MLEELVAEVERIKFLTQQIAYAYNTVLQTIPSDNKFSSSFNLDGVASPTTLPFVINRDELKDQLCMSPFNFDSHFILSYLILCCL